MIERISFNARTWVLNSEVGTYPCILERLRGTPARLEEMLRDFPPDKLQERPNGKWSVLQEVGHLWVADHYFDRRVDQILAGEDHVQDIRIENPQFSEESLQTRDLDELLADFRKKRMENIRRSEDLDETDLARSSHWPQLDLTVRVVDHYWFVAEHDDAHVAALYQLKRRFAG